MSLEDVASISILVFIGLFIGYMVHETISGRM